MLRANRMTPPRPNSRASDLSSIGTAAPLNPAINSWPIWRRREGMVGQIIIRGVQTAASAPTRIDLAGGTIDIWPLYLFHEGASTLNAAISLRAHASIEARSDGAVVLQSVDVGREHRAAHWSELTREAPLPLLALLARYYRLESATLVTRGESPAGAGIAGSSALTIAACGALAGWTGESTDGEQLLQVAMNVECQTIRVPTGVQDYRPALYG